MNPSHEPQKVKQSDLKSAQSNNFESQTPQAYASVLQLQRTIGNRATIQRLKNPHSLSAATDALTETETMTEQEASSDIQGPIQRAALMTGDAMLEVAPYTTNLIGKKKATAYNTLVDALKAYWTYASATKRQIKAPMGGEDLTGKLDAVIEAAQAWVTKHGASKKSADAIKQPAVHKTLVAALKLKKDITTTRDTLTAESQTITGMYSTPALWARMVDWSNNVWHLEENTNFYTSIRTFTSVGQGKEIIAKHLLDRRVGRHDLSPELFNVSGPLFNRAAALIARPDSELAVADFQSLFDDCVAAAGQIWGDLTSKARNDIPQADRDSFVFGYILAAVPGILA
jgi:hypothetical protein